MGFLFKYRYFYPSSATLRSQCQPSPVEAQHCCTLQLLAFSAAALPKALSLTQIPQIIELPSNHNKGYWPGNHWLHSQHGKNRDHSVVWKQDPLLWLHTSEWVPFKGTKVPSFSIRPGEVTRASFSSGLSSLRVWLCSKLFLIGQLLLISSANNYEVEKHNAPFVISLMKTSWDWTATSVYPFKCTETNVNATTT